MNKKFIKDLDLNGWLVLVLVTAAGVVYFQIFRVFLIPLIASLVAAVLLYPLFTRISSFLGNRRALVSLLFCFLLLGVLFVPSYFLGREASRQAREVYTDLKGALEEAVADGEAGEFWRRFTESNLITWLEQQGFEWKSWIRSLTDFAGNTASTIINRASSSIFGILGGIFVFLFSLFYFFRDGEKLKRRIRDLSPLRPDHEGRFARRFQVIARAVILGTVVIGLIQGTLGSVTFLVLGIRGWVLWGSFMIILAIIPFVGIYLIMVPAAIIHFITGDIVTGIVLLVIGTAINWLVDYLVRPWFVGRESRIHDLLIFFSTIGGIYVYGVMGFIVGPVILTVLLTLLDIYGVEIKPLFKGEEKGGNSHGGRNE
ncbi:MAG: AI-2E family transporter [Spirochaetota bacterium]